MKIKSFIDCQELVDACYDPDKVKFEFEFTLNELSDLSIVLATYIRMLVVIDNFDDVILNSNLTNYYYLYDMLAFIPVKSGYMSDRLNRGNLLGNDNRKWG